MYSDKTHSHPTRDSHVLSWHPVQSSPSQDMWELPSNGTTPSFGESNDGPGVSTHIHERELHNEHGVPVPDMEASMQVGTRNGTRGMTMGEDERWVLSDTTNIVQRMNNTSPMTNRVLRRSNFS
jgi:hypothetical protein